MTTPAHFWDPASSESEDDETGFVTPSSSSHSNDDRSNPAHHSKHTTHHATFHTPSQSGKEHEEEEESEEADGEESEIKVQIHSEANSRHKHKHSKSITSMRLPVEMSDEEIEEEDEGFIEEEDPNQVQQEDEDEDGEEVAEEEEEEKESVSISSFTPTTSLHQASASLSYAFNPMLSAHLINYPSAANSANTPNPTSASNTSNSGASTSKTNIINTNSNTNRENEIITTTKPPVLTRAQTPPVVTLPLNPSPSTAAITPNVPANATSNSNQHGFPLPLPPRRPSTLTGIVPIVSAIPTSAGTFVLSSPLKPIPQPQSSGQSSANPSFSPPQTPSTTHSVSFSSPSSVTTSSNSLSLSSPASSSSSVSSSSIRSSFAASLTHSFAPITRQVESGLYVSKRTASLLKKISLLEEEYSSGLRKGLREELHKVNKLSNNSTINPNNPVTVNTNLMSGTRGDCMESTGNVWAHCHRLFHAYANTYQDNAQQVMIEVVFPLLEEYRTGEESRKEVIGEERRVSSEMGKAREEVTKAQQMTMKLLNAAKSSSTNDKKSSSKHSATTTSTQAAALLASLSKHFTKSTKSLVAEATTSAARYAQAVQNANSRQLKYCHQDLPRVLGEMERIEAMRIDGMKQKLLKYTQIQSTVLKNRLNIIQQLEREIQAIDATSDIHGYIQQTLIESGPTPPPLPFEYDLPYTQKDIEAGRFDRHPNSVFRTNLLACLTLQQEKKWPVETPTIPRIVSVLCKNIEERGGFETEGIFRISASKSELDRLHEQLDTGDYEIINREVTSPHTSAGLLKEWLRLLEEPLIGDELYDKVIGTMKEIMNNNNNNSGNSGTNGSTPNTGSGGKTKSRGHSRQISKASMAAAAADKAAEAGTSNVTAAFTLHSPATSFLSPPTSPPLDSSASTPNSPLISAAANATLFSIYSSLPLPNQSLLHYLSLFLARFSPVKTRMSWENYGIVFAPSLLRCKIDDPLVLLENSKYEGKFTSLLFQLLSSNTLNVPTFNVANLANFNKKGSISITGPEDLEPKRTSVLKT